MKFFWKLFFSTTAISAVFFSIGSYYLIYSGFNNSLQREIQSISMENEMIISSVKSELRSALKDTYGTDKIFMKYLESYGITEDSFSDLPLDLIGSVVYDSGNQAATIGDEQVDDYSAYVEKWMNDTISSMTVSVYGEIIPFKISNSKSETICESKWRGIKGKLIDELNNDTRGYEIINSGNDYFIHYASSFSLFENTLYVENYRSVTNIFNNRIQQQRSGMYLTVIMLFSMAAVSFIVSKWLTKPINELSAASHKFSEGDFTDRVQINSNDEIGELSNDFNSMADRIEETVERLQDLAERQEAFVNSFAHELKTPLTSIIGYADMMRSKEMSTEHVVEYSDIIFKEGKRLEVMSMKLMELIVLKKQDFEFRPISSKKLLQAVANTVRPILIESGIKFCVKVENAVIFAEPDLIKTVCINLLDNARKSINSGGIIVLLGKKLNDGYVISIIDNGRGMRKDELKKITDPFYMVDKSRARLQGGAGLGLAICSEIAKVHGSTLEFKSELGKGTCVSIRLKTEDAICRKRNLQ